MDNDGVPDRHDGYDHFDLERHGPSPLVQKVRLIAMIWLGSVVVIFHSHAM